MNASGQRVKSEQTSVFAKMVPAILFVIVGLFALAYRFVSLGYGLSFDESFVAYVAKMSWHSLVSVIQAEGRNPPLYYAVAKVWSSVAGTGDIALRILSALIGTAGVVMFATYVRSWWGKRASIVAFSLAGTSVVWVVMSREARMYPLLMLLIVLSIGTFWRWYRSPTAWNAVIYVVATAFMLLTHLTAAPVVFAQVVFVLWYSRPMRRALRHVALVAAAPLLVGIGWFSGVLWYQHTHPFTYQIFNRDAYGLLRGGFEVIRDYVMFYHGTFVLPRAAVFLYHFGHLFLFATVVLAIAMIVQKLIRRTIPERDRRLLTLFVSVFACSIALTVFLRPMPKYFLPACVAFTAIVTHGVAMWWRKSAVVATVIALGLFVSAVVELPALVNGEPLPWRSYAEYIEAHEIPGDVVLIHLWPDELTFRRYYQGSADVRGVFPITLSSDYTYATALAHLNPAQVVTADNISAWLEDATENHQRVWLILDNKEEFFGGQYVEQWFDEQGWSVSSEPEIRYAQDASLMLYEKATP